MLMHIQSRGASTVTSSRSADVTSTLRNYEQNHVDTPSPPIRHREVGLCTFVILF